MLSIVVFLRCLGYFVNKTNKGLWGFLYHTNFKETFKLEDLEVRGEKNKQFKSGHLKTI